MEDEELALLLELEGVDEEELLGGEEEELDDGPLELLELEAEDDELLGGWLLDDDGDDELDAELLELGGADELLEDWLLDDDCEEELDAELLELDGTAPSTTVSVVVSSQPAVRLYCPAGVLPPIFSPAQMTFRPAVFELMTIRQRELAAS
jgi:hypothetical protein